MPADGFVPAPQAIARIVYVSAIDKDGNPVTDLQQADFELKVDGKKSTIVNVRPAEAPMRIALIVSDAGTGGFQLGLATFMQRLLGRAEFSLISVIVQPETVVDYSSEAGVLKAGLLSHGSARTSARRAAHGDHPGGDETRPARRHASRHPGHEGRRRSDHFHSRKRRSRTAAAERRHPVRRVHGRRGTCRASVRPRPGISTEQAQMQDSEVADGAFNLAQVLGDGSKDSGGRHEQVISTTLVPALERVANELLNQYAISYMLPDGARAWRQAVAVVEAQGGQTAGPVAYSAVKGTVTFSHVRFRKS